jgi:uncharacterized membrane protein (DUF106 family)
MDLSSLSNIGAPALALMVMALSGALIHVYRQKEAAAQCFAHQIKQTHETCDARIDALIAAHREDNLEAIKALLQAQEQAARMRATKPPASG